MTRNNSKREHKGMFLRSENSRSLLTKPCKRMWNVMKITSHCSCEPDSGGLKSAKGASHEEDSEGFILHIQVCTEG